MFRDIKEFLMKYSVYPLWDPKGFLLNIFLYFIPRKKRLGHDSDHSPPSSTEVKNKWSYTSIPPYTRGAKTLSRSHVSILETGCVTRSKFHTVGPNNFNNEPREFSRLATKRKGFVCTLHLGFRDVERDKMSELRTEFCYLLGQ